MQDNYKETRAKRKKFVRNTSMGRTDRSYKDLKQKQKSAIADKTYSMYIRFYLENHRMPNAYEKSSICKKLFATVQAVAPKIDYEESCSRK